MSFAYYLIDNMTHNGCKIYYKKPIDTTMQPAKELNEKYIYPQYADEDGKNGKINFLKVMCKKSRQKKL